MYIIIGNIIALIASLAMVYSVFFKEKKKILYIQTIQIFLFIVSNIVLGGITGAIVNALSCIRNILCYKNKLGLKEKLIITILSIFTLIFNNLGLIGVLPLISSIIFLWLMNVKDVKKFKYLIIFTTFLWLVYDLFIKSYTSAIFDFATIIANIISIVQLKKLTNKKSVLYFN